MRRLLPVVLLCGCAFGDRSAPDGAGAELAPRDLQTAPELGPPGPRDLSGAVDQAGQSVVVLNEAFADGAGVTPDYGEVKNLGNVPVDLSGFLIGDDAKDFPLPPGTVVPGAGYLVVYFDKSGAGPAGLYTGFGLGQGGDELHLRYPDGRDVVPPLRWGAAPLPVLEKGQSFGRLPDGTGDLRPATPTPGSANRP